MAVVLNIVENYKEIIDNLDGTYKIRCEGGVLDAGSNVNTYREQNNQNQKFIITETEPPTVGSPAVISPDIVFLIRNVRSRLYIHREENAPVYQKNSDGDIAYDDNNKPIVESYLTNQAIQHEDKDYIEEETKFKFVPTGKQGEYYIKSVNGVNGDVALCINCHRVISDIEAGSLHRPFHLQKNRPAQIFSLTLAALPKRSRR